MAKPNTTFNLDVKDLELIEDALHSVIAKRSNDLITASDAQNSAVDRASAEAEMSEMRDLLAACTTRKIGSVRKRATAISAANPSFRSVSPRGDAFRNSASHATGDAHAGHNGGVRRFGNSGRLGRGPDQNGARFHQNR